MKLTYENLKKHFSKTEDVYLREDKLKELKNEIIEKALSYVKLNLENFSENDFKGPSLLNIDFVSKKGFELMNFKLSDKYIKNNIRCLNKARDELLINLFSIELGVNQLNKYGIYYKELTEEFLIDNLDFLNKELDKRTYDLIKLIHQLTNIKNSNNEFLFNCRIGGIYFEYIFKYENEDIKIYNEEQEELISYETDSFFEKLLFIEIEKTKKILLKYLSNIESIKDIKKDIYKEVLKRANLYLKSTP